MDRQTIAAALDEAGARWSLLRDDAEAVSELDLLVHPADLGLAERTVRGLGFAPLPTFGRGSHRFHIVYEPSTDQWTKLDIVTELAFGRYAELPTRCAIRCLERRVQAPPPSVWTRLNSDDAFWALFLHCALDGGELRTGRRRQLTQLAAAATPHGPVASWVAQAMDPAELLLLIRTDVDAGLARARELPRRLPRRLRAASTARRIGNHLVRNGLRPLARHRRRALCVALLAPDGAGKSTLQGQITATWPMPAGSVYLGLYPPGGDVGGRLPGMGLALRLVRFWRRYGRARLQRAAGVLMLFDRHPVDALILDDAPRALRRRVRRWVIAHACPAPDLAIVLDAPAATLYERSHEREVAELDDHRARYLAYARDHRRRAEATVVDAGGPPEEVRRAVTQAIWQVWAARLATSR